MNPTTFLYLIAHAVVTALILRWLYRWLMAIPCKFEQAELESDNEQHRFFDDGTCSRDGDSIECGQQISSFENLRLRIDPDAPIPYQLTPLADTIRAAGLKQKHGRISSARLPLHQHKTRAQLQAETDCNATQH